MYVTKRLGLGEMVYDPVRKGFFDTITGYQDKDVLIVGGRDYTGYYKPTGTYYDTRTGQQFGTNPPQGVSPVSWYQEGVDIVVPVGPGAVAQTQAQATAMQQEVANSLAAQSIQAQAGAIVSTQGSTVSSLTDKLKDPWVLGIGAIAVYFMFLRGRR